MFVDPRLEWRPVSPRLITERRLVVAVLVAVSVVLVVGGLVTSTGGPLIGIGVVGLVVAAVWWVAAARIVSAWRYAEREQDLLINRGRIRRRLVVVPYGRMQVIDVSANPISRRLGIATVTLVTASASTNAHIPGLPAAEAQQLRDRLAAKGEALGAGL